MIAGFETPTSGQILMDGVDITHVPANERGLGFVFQNYALFPHMKIFDNVAYGLKIRGESGESMAKKVREALAMVGLTKEENRYPNQLSGGQRQLRCASSRFGLASEAFVNGRTAFKFGRETSSSHANGDPSHSTRSWYHLLVCHSRPKRSAHDVRPHHGDEPRTH